MASFQKGDGARNLNPVCQAVASNRWAAALPFIFGHTSTATDLPLPFASEPMRVDGCWLMFNDASVCHDEGQLFRLFQASDDNRRARTGRRDRKHDFWARGYNYVVWKVPSCSVTSSEFFLRSITYSAPFYRFCYRSDNLKKSHTGIRYSCLISAAG